jgi:O-antigen/teichoic acid export membrane protein
MRDEIAAAGERQPDVGAPAAATRDIGRNAGAFAVAQVTVRLVGLVVVVVVARLLSNVDFGRYSVALALSSLLTLPVESGMGGYLVREGTQSPSRVGVVLGHVLSIQLALGVAALSGAAAIGLALGYDRETLLTALLMTAAAVVFVVTRSFLAILVSLKQARTFAAYSAGQALGLAALTLVAALAGAGPVGIAGASLGTAALSFPVAFAALRRHWHLPITFQRQGLGETFAVSVAYSAAKLGSSLLTYVDAVMVQAIRGNGAAAEYGAAYRFLLAFRMFPLIYSDALSQPAARLARTDSAALAEIYNRATSQLLILGLPIAVGGALLGEPLMVSVFGERYAGAGTTAALLLVTLALSFPYEIMTVTALAAGLERRVATAYGATVVVNVVANAFLIPRFGPEGAATAMVISTPVYAALIAYQLSQAGIPLRFDARYRKAALASLAMGAVVVLPDGLPLVATVLAGATVYVGLLVALRTFDARDLDMLPGGKRLGRLVRAPMTQQSNQD